ncbi:MAG: histidine triad nucleotide-binding protein [Ectothiorhodospiraceae bacterium]|nr:histidine triad nucleotide-binding protein [Ectothiorhodospiraceae bacterium]MCH8502888.1 histidine triad nucleotide-binding protein [Ectothiorhodospiraceae bacterium]
MTDCLFCKMANNEIPVDLVLETEHLMAFRDINPQAPQHVLIIPRVHVRSLEDLEPGQEDLAGTLLLAAQQVARQEGFADRGYRTVINSGHDGGQEVQHLHVHVLAGRRMQWPPG